MSYLRKNIADMTAYVPGFQPPDEAGWVKLNTNENPYPPSPKVVEAIRQATGDDLRKYPDPASLAARRAAADLYGYPVDWVIMANGSDELLNNLIRACAGEGEEVAYLHPSFNSTHSLYQFPDLKRQYRINKPEAGISVREIVNEISGNWEVNELSISLNGVVTVIFK